MFADNERNSARGCQLQDKDHTHVRVDQDAKLTIDTTLRFDPDDEWWIYNPRFRLVDGIFRLIVEGYYQPIVNVVWFEALSL